MKFFSTNEIGYLFVIISFVIIISRNNSEHGLCINNCGKSVLRGFTSIV